jgi:hypothetical protein
VISVTKAEPVFSADWQLVASFDRVTGLSFGLRYDCNNACSNKDVSVIMPFSGPSLAISEQELEVDPVQLPTPV